MCTHELICAIDRKVLKMLSISNGFRVFAAYKKYQRQKTPPMLWPPTVVPLCVQCVRYINTHTHKHTFSHSILVSNIRHSVCVCVYVVLLHTFYPIHNVVWSFIVLRCSFRIYTTEWCALLVSVCVHLNMYCIIYDLSTWMIPLCTISLLFDNNIESGRKWREYENVCVHKTSVQNN